MMKIDQQAKTICFVAAHAPSSSGWGGVVRSVGAYIKLANVAGFRTELIASSATLSGTVSEQSVRAACPVDEVHLYPARISRKWAVGFGIFSRLGPLFKSDAVVIYGVRVWPVSIAAAVCRVFRRPFIIIPAAGLDSTRAFEIQRKRPFLYMAYRAFTRWSLKAASSIVVSGALEAANLEPWVPRDKVTCIQNFFFFDLERPYIAPTHRRRYIFVGRLSADKGILGFLRIWQKSASPDSEFLLVGSGDGMYFAELRQIIANDARVKHIGELSNDKVYEAILSSSILVLPTGIDLPVTENFGNVVVESLICGRPVMVSAGLHWDEYKNEEGLEVFELNENAIRLSIANFEALDEHIFVEKSRGAFDLAKKFHYSKALQQFNRLVAVNPSADVRNRTTRTIYITVIRHAPGMYKEAIAVATALRSGDRESRVIVAKQRQGKDTDNDIMVVWSLPIICQILRQFSRRRSGLVFYFWNNHPLNIVLSILASLHPEWRTIICCHEPRKNIKGLPWRFRVRRTVAEIVQSLTLQLADAANVVSENGYLRFRGAYPRFRKPVFQTGLFLQDLERGSENLARDMVCFPGAPNGSTGHDDFFRIAPALAKAGVKVCLLHVGAPQSEFWITPTQLAHAGVISSDKTLTDFDIFNVFRRSFAVIRFDKTSSQSGTIPVAFMAGTPVVVRRSPGLVTDVSHGANAVVLDETIETGDVLNAIDLILRNFSAMTNAARETYLRKFDMCQNKSRILEMFEALNF